MQRSTLVRRRLPDWISLSSDSSQSRKTTSEFQFSPEQKGEEQQEKTMCANEGQTCGEISSTKEFSHMIQDRVQTGWSHSSPWTRVFLPCDISVRQSNKRRKIGTERMASHQNTCWALRTATCDPFCPPETLQNMLLEQASFSETENSRSYSPTTLQLFLTHDEFGFFPLDHAIQMVVKCFMADFDGYTVNSISNSSHWDMATREQTATMALERLAVLLSFQAYFPSLKNMVNGPRPLIRLLSNITFCGSSSELDRGTFQGYLLKTHDAGELDPNIPSSWLLKCVELILKLWPESLFHTAITTGGTCLHVALLHACNTVPLINLILAENNRQHHHHSLLLQRNHAGDLPIHIASRSQAPLPVLRIVVELTMRTAISQNDQSFWLLCGNGSLGSMNHVGWSALELEFMRYLEGGELAHYPNFESFAPWHNGSNATARRNEGGRRMVNRSNPINFNTSDDGLIRDDIISPYEEIWQRAIGRLILMDQHGSGEDLSNTYGYSDRSFSSSQHFESQFFPRIVLLLNAAAATLMAALTTPTMLMTPPPTLTFIPSLESTNCILHRASLLCTPSGMMRDKSLCYKNPIPWFLLEYLSWKYPNQSHQLDMHGKLPLHYCLILNKWCIWGEEARIYFSRSCPWFKWIEKLLVLYPQAIQTRDGQGRLPLHCFLDSLLQLRETQSTESAHHGTEVPEPPESNNKLFRDSSLTKMTTLDLLLDDTVELLVRAFPMSLELHDPVTGLFPFLQIAAYGSVTATYRWLRHCPTALGPQRMHLRHSSRLS